MIATFCPKRYLCCEGMMYHSIEIQKSGAEGNPSKIDNGSILMVDNLEMHIYFKRHTLFMDMMNKFMPNHQKLITTHSKIMIDNVEDSYKYDMEEYVF